MSAKHTPGPWSVDPRHGSFEIVGRPVWPSRRFGTDGEWTVATVPDLYEDNEAAIDEGEANAYLIAAAPDLLAALKHCVIERSEWLDEARAAIAKAEGRS